MSQTIMKPDSIKQKEPRTDTGLRKEGPFLAVTRKGKAYAVNKEDQRDEKYYHLWDNLDNLKYGKVARCGKTNAHTCSVKKEHGIVGYRDICPIAGVTGTYVQPSPIELKFKPSDYDLNDNTKITKLKLSFKHRCTSVNVESKKKPEYEGVSPNFSGFKHYPNHKVLTVTFNGQTKTMNTNPPLSLKNYSNVSFEFNFPKGITGKTLRENPIVISYGNNFESDAGILYVDNLSLTVDYVGKKLFFEATQKDSTIYTSEDSDCGTTIQYVLKVGYKEGNKIVTPKNQQKNITYSAPTGVSAEFAPQSDGVTVIATVKDTSLIAGKKNIYFTFTSNNQKIGFSFTSILRPKPQISLSSQIEKNVVMSSPIIVMNNGCTKTLKAYVGSPEGEAYTFGTLTLDAPNMIGSTDIAGFYSFLQKQSCGPHVIYFQRGNETADKMIQKTITIIPTEYNVEAYYNDKKISEKIKGILQNKKANQKIKLKYIPGNKVLINKPAFSIINPTYGRIETLSNGTKIPTRYRINESGISWSPEKTGGEVEIDLGTYYSGDYTIQVQESNNCNRNNMNIDVEILPDHKQTFSSVFIRGEDSTAFDYDYLVAFEGDNIQEPIYPTSVGLGASYKDISICINKEQYIAKINDTEVITLQITNNSENDIQNLQLELNMLKKDEDGNYYVSTDEWVENGGIFSNLQKDFFNYNEDSYSILNLTEDADKIDEENVYINIKHLPSKKTIPINLPFGSFMEKENYLQILLFEEPMEISLCHNVDKKITEIPLIVFDSILTEMNISGDIDILFPNKNCPYECFQTENGIRYSVKNIDSSDVDGEARFIIDNDPRLVPYKISYKNKKGNIINNQPVYEKDESLTTISFADYALDIPNDKASINIVKDKEFNIQNDLNKIFLKFSVLKNTNGSIKITQYKTSSEEEDIIFFNKPFSEITKEETNKGNASINYTLSLNDISEKLENIIQKKYFLVQLLDATGTNVITAMSFMVTKKSDDFSFPVKIISGNKTEQRNCRGIKIQCDVDFGTVYPKESYTAYTDASSIATFFVKIPVETSRDFTVNSLIKNKICKFTCQDTLTLPTEDYMIYHPGQIVPIKVKATKTVSYLENKIIFTADIQKSGKKDFIDIYYRVCNLENNEGQLQTTFKTKTDEGEYNLIPNEVSETILCGTQTDITPFVSLEKLVVENKHINRLHISLKNKKRFNKDISITISEKNNDNIDKYKYLSHSIDIGDISINNTEIVWSIDYLQKDSFVKGYIDFEAQNIGISNLQIDVQDFLSDIDKSKFGIQCPCRKPNEV